MNRIKLIIYLLFLVCLLPTNLLPVSVGKLKDFKIKNVIFKMVYVPDTTNFPVGLNDNKIETISESYWIGETEITYELWFSVRVWAEKNGYKFAYKGKEGSFGKPGAAPTEAKTNPVTGISWRDSLIWVNALTELYNLTNKTKYTCVYYEDIDLKKPIKRANKDPYIYSSKGSQDNPYVNEKASGFRMLKSEEWELAARYKDGKRWTPGFYLSGAERSHTKDKLYIDESMVEEIAWFNKSETQEVKGLRPNALGLYDMSGNVWEWCFNQHPNKKYFGRIIRGGSCFYWIDGFLVGFVNKNAPYSPSYDVGLRVAMTAFGD